MNSRRTNIISSDTKEHRFGIKSASLRDKDSRVICKRIVAPFINLIGIYATDIHQETHLVTLRVPVIYSESTSSGTKNFYVRRSTYRIFEKSLKEQLQKYINVPKIREFILS